MQGKTPKTLESFKGRVKSNGLKIVNLKQRIEKLRARGIPDEQLKAT